MDFSNRIQQNTAGITNPNSATAPTEQKKGQRKRNSDGGKGWRLGYVVILVAVAILIAAIALLFFTTKGEYGYVNSKDYQVVDINVAGGTSDQIYFGNIKNINDRYVVLENVFYIPSNSNSSSITLQPLVCQVEAPLNRMVINRNSVNWWENLQPNGKVAQALTKYQQKPTGCSSSSSSSSNSSNSSSSSTSSSSSSTSGSTSTTPSSSTTKTTAPTTTKP